VKIEKKILHSLEELRDCVNDIHVHKMKIVLCQGHFNVIHPGHIRFLEFSKKQGDFFIVVVQGQKKIDPAMRDKFFKVNERARGVASLEYVDKVFIFEDGSFEELLKIVKPSAYVMGEEFSLKINIIDDQIKLVESFGGKVIFSSGDVRYESTEFLDKTYLEIAEQRKKLFYAALSKQNISIKKLFAYSGAFHNVHILVIGDTIVDQYIACDALGMSSEAPVLVVRELETKEFVGGAAIVARHVRSLGAKCTFISLIGNDQPGEMITHELANEHIEAHLMRDNGRPTTFKIRYMVGTQKVLRVSRLQDKHLDKKMEEDVIKKLYETIESIDAIIVSDFSYGLITPRIVNVISEIANQYNVKLFGDVQSSSQIGNISRLINYYCLTPTEKEARITLEDKYSGLEMIGTNLIKLTRAHGILLKIGAEGFVSFENTKAEVFIKTQHFPALNPTPVDVVGAGDSLLTGLAVSSCSGATLMEASAIGAIVASIAVSKIGNIPVSISELQNYLRSLQDREHD